MCDTLVVVEAGRVLFAKNSDRDPNEAQRPEWHPRRSHAPGGRVRCTHLEIPQVPETHAVLISRPFWMWGAEIGANEHGVTIGNEAVFTKQPYARNGLTGMDLLRLALERADTAKGAVSVITELLEAYGQGGSCSLERPGFTYHNSYIVADPREAYVLETAGKLWAVEPIKGARSISNGLTIPDFAATHAAFVYTWGSRCAIRQPLTQARAERARGIADMIAILRDHGTATPAPAYSRWFGGLNAPCVHPSGLFKAAQTTASWVAELSPEGSRHWLTGTSAPCTSLFKPVSITEPLDLGPEPTDRADDRSLWWRHERLHRPVMRNPEQLGGYYAERDATEARWIASPPAPTEAFREADDLLDRWLAATAQRSAPDTRPGWVRRYAKARDRRAGLIS